MRELALGYEPGSVVDQMAIRELMGASADLGRLGGLLKMWLTNDERAGFARHLNVPELLEEIRTLQGQIYDKVKSL